MYKLLKNVEWRENKKNFKQKIFLESSAFL